MAERVSPKEIRAMILAAGFGIRMQKGGEQKPKPLAELCGHPLIAYPLAALRGAGFKEVIINLHHRGEEIKKELGTGKSYGIKIKYIWEPEILGTGGGIKNANQHYPARRWLTINADTIIDLDLRALVQFHRRFYPIATMVLTPATSDKFNPVYADSLGRVRRIGTAPENVSGEITLSKFFYCGVQIVSAALLEYLLEGYSKIIQDGYLKALAKGNPVLSCVFRGFWLTVDDPKTKLQAQTEHQDRLEKFFR